MKKYVTVTNGMGGTVMLSQQNVAEIAKTNGFCVLEVPRYDSNSLSDDELKSRNEKLLEDICTDDVVVIQFPSWNGNRFDRMLISLLKQKNARVILFVNDVEPLLFNSGEEKLNACIEMYNMSDALILPSEKMHKYLLDRGLIVNIVVYQIVWDYFSMNGYEAKRLKYRFCYPGNPDRSAFLLEWRGKTILEAYGKQEYTIPEGINTVRRGFIENSMLIKDMSEGGFGLLWSEGTQFEYYKMNQTYKLPTYIAAGIPIIVREGFNVAEFVKQNGIGYVVSSLQEADDIVQNITEEEYVVLVNRVREVQKEIINGKNTQRILNEVIEKCGDTKQEKQDNIFNSDDRKIIENGLKMYPDDYKYYEKYGDVLACTNKEQAFLCYENAAFLCNDITEKERLNALAANMKAECANIKKCAIIILNYNLCDITRECIESIRETTSEASRIITIVDNGSSDGSIDYLRDQKDIILVENSENAGFPKGCNQGIEAVDEECDVLLLNNDTVMCKGTLFWLRMGLYADEKYGVAGAVTNRIIAEQEVVEDGKSLKEYQAFAEQNNRFMRNAYEMRYFVTGFCMLIRHKLVDEIGVLDERFGIGNFEDNDYCLRAVKAGYKCVLVHNSFIVHWGSKSFGRRNDYWQLIEKNRKYFESKHGVIWGKYDKCDELYSYVKAVDFVKEANNILLPFGIQNASVMRLKWEYPDICFDEDVIENKKYDIIVLDLRGEKDVDFDKCLSMLSYLSDRGKAIIMANNSRYYQRWLPVAMGEIYQYETMQHAITSANSYDNILNQKGYRVERWSFNYCVPNDAATEAIMDKLAKALNQTADSFYIKFFTIIASKW